MTVDAGWLIVVAGLSWLAGIVQSFYYCKSKGFLPDDWKLL